MCYTVHKRSHTSLCERLIKVRSGHFLDWYYCTSQLISTTDPINKYSSQQVQFKFYLMKNWRENFSFSPSHCMELFFKQQHTIYYICIKIKTEQESCWLLWIYIQYFPIRIWSLIQSCLYIWRCCYTNCQREQQLWGQILQSSKKVLAML